MQSQFLKNSPCFLQALCKFRWKCQEERAAKRLVKNVGEFTIPHFRDCYKIVVIRRVWYWNQDKQVDH
jgi:hypothetical protein